MSLKFALLLSFLATPAMAQDCSPIRFAPGESGAFVKGDAPAEGSACYSIDLRPGQKFFAEIVTGQADIAISIPGIGDNRNTFSFVTQQSRYELWVHQTFRAVEDAPFTMLVRVD
ncbi:hypothetical protein SAMN05421538_102351 [Paracoccus isoporae]|uniref:Secreted protein n=1 Tax=Paracoccus isoporae TaxID=591205 RepID=A0A1G6XB08_9RHOB|nr:hypothetical protein [Paracoccus isoporae]SDD75338.1 hypothetical protein SAMN05421538_102351 [Paracoccus isoporae]